MKVTARNSIQLPSKSTHRISLLNCHYTEGFPRPFFIAKSLLPHLEMKELLPVAAATIVVLFAFQHMKVRAGTHREWHAYMSLLKEEREPTASDYRLRSP